MATATPRTSPSAGSWFRRRVARIGLRLFAANVVALAVLGLALFALPTLEGVFSREAHRALGGEAEMVAAAISAKPGLRSREVERLLREVRARSGVRARIIDAEGWLIADSQRVRPAREPDPHAPTAQATPRIDQRAITALWTWLEERRERWLPRPPVQPNPYLEDPPYLSPEILAALAGREGRAQRVHVDGAVPTLYSARPIIEANEVTGAALLSRSAEEAAGLRRSVEHRLLQVFLGIALFSLLLTAGLTLSIARPLRRLRDEAGSMFDRRGRIRGRLGAVRRGDEIGDLARTLEALSGRVEERVGFIEGFAADVSHEFKNPLASIRVATEIISDMDDPGERKRFFSIVERDVARMERLLDALREVTQIDAQRDPGDEGPVDLKMLLSQLAEAFRMRIGDRVKIEVSAPADELSVYGGQGRLVQVFENLLDNAVSFSGAGGRVYVRAERDEDDVVVSVEDEGPGIPDHHRERVFRRFFSYRPKGAGGPGDEDDDRSHTGLGLAIVKAIVESYGGSVSAESASSGGALFCVRLPAL